MALLVFYSQNIVFNGVREYFVFERWLVCWEKPNVPFCGWAFLSSVCSLIFAL